MKALLHFLYVRRLGLLLLALLGLLLFWARPPSAQQAYLRQFGPTEGFQPPFVYALLQDRQGYFWLGTGEGLVRYDGAHFVTFTKKDGLTEDFVVSLREEPASGRLWVGHYQGGISVKKSATGPFTPANRAAIPAALRLPADGLPPVDTTASRPLTSTSAASPKIPTAASGWELKATACSAAKPRAPGSTSV